MRLKLLLKHTFNQKKDFVTMELLLTFVKIDWYTASTVCKNTRKFTGYQSNQISWIAHALSLMLVLFSHFN